MEEQSLDDLAAEKMEKYREFVIENLAGKIEWKDVDDPDRGPITAEEAKKLFKDELRKIFDEGEKTDARSFRGFKIILQHLGEYPNDRLCLKELENAGKTMMSSIKKTLGPNLEKTREILSKDIDFEKLSAAISKQQAAREDQLQQADQLEQQEPIKSELPPSVAETLNLSQDTLETFYQIGSKLYADNSVDQATCVFTYLSQLDSYNHEVWVSLAMCHHRAKEWTPAINAYSMSSVIKPEDPIPYLYIIDCFLALGQLEQATMSLHMAEYFLNDENREKFSPLIAKYETRILEHSS